MSAARSAIGHTTAIGPHSMIRRLSILWTIACFAGIAAFAVFADEPAAPLAGHSTHGEAFNEGPRQKAYLMGTTGKVRFPVTTRSPEAQQFIEQGVGQLHGFWYFEAERSFRQAAALDPECAMAYWGMAMANTENDKRAKSFIAEAVKRKENLTEREKMYIDAREKYLKVDGDKRKDRGREYARDLERILYKFPDDVEARALLALQLWQNDGKGAPISSYLAIEALLQQVFAAEPMHPAHHYRIHLWDYEKADMALPSAARCGQSSPGIAHMWHMPGHIYSRLHRYPDAVWQQEASARVDHAHMMRDRVLPDQIHNFAHNNEWLIRNLGYIGKAHAGIDLAKNMIELPRHPKHNHLGKNGSTHFGRLRLFEILDHYELWDDLIALSNTTYLEPTDKGSEQAKRLRYLGRAWFRKGDTERGLAQLTAIEERLLARQNAQREAGDKAAEKAKADGKNEKDVERAGNDARNPFADEIRTLEHAVEELLGMVALAGGDADTGFALLGKAGGLDDVAQARLNLAAGRGDEAERKARKAVDAGANEVLPLAALTEVQYRLNKQDEAKATFERLRKISQHIDLDVPQFVRLAPIAKEFGYSEDWRQPDEARNDVGERPSLDSLGPFRWSPSPALPWALKDAEDRAITLESYHGRPVVVIFYLGYGCLHCAQQLQAFAPKVKEFADAGISVVAISTDSREDLRKSIENYKDGAFPIPLVSNADQDVFKSWRVYDDFENRPLHGTFLIDAAGLVRWQDISYEPFMDVDFLLKESQRQLGRFVEGEAIAAPTAPVVRTPAESD
ncbi:MAG TPA: peroxiredoxin family protein [Planctomycetaceae bacterium]|nr:peroxiredoxin family protein [Planctomycetaceae bacterium]